jgi:hypothetical protein
MGIAVLIKHDDVYRRLVAEVVYLPKEAGAR